MTTVIAMSNHKGGVGKTTSVVNIGAGLAKLNKKVLLIDLDPQANLTQSLGIENTEFNIYGALKGEYELKPVNVIAKLDIIPSTLDLSGAELELSTEAGREFILKECIEKLNGNYDYILIDCPPSLGLLTINALTAATDVFVPLQAHFLPMKGLTKIIEVIDKVKKRLNRDLAIGGVFVTQFDRRKILHRDVAESTEEYFPGKVFKTKIRDNISLAEAPTAGTDIFRYAPNSFGAQDYEQLCREITGIKKRKSA